MSNAQERSSDAEWMQKIIAASNPKKEEPAVVATGEQEKIPVSKSNRKSSFNWSFLLCLLLFLIALLPRLYFLFFSI